MMSSRRHLTEEKSQTCKMNSYRLISAEVLRLFSCFLRVFMVFCEFFEVFESFLMVYKGFFEDSSGFDLGFLRLLRVYCDDGN
jgi:hypothetical protein